MRWMAAMVIGLSAASPRLSPADQPVPLFSVVADTAKHGAMFSTGPRPTRGAVVEFALGQLAEFVATAPPEQPSIPLHAYGAVLELPGPTGEPVRCYAAASPVMEPELQAKFPGMRTLIVQTADRAAAGRVEVTQRGVTGMLRSGQGVWMIDLAKLGDPTRAVSYWLHDLHLDGPDAGAWSCETVEGVHGHGMQIQPADGGGFADRGPDPGVPAVLRTVRLAVACTGEYGLNQCNLLGHAPNVADPLAAIVTAVSRVNVVYESDLALRLILVANNDRIVYTDPLTDPYPDTCDGTAGGDCSGSYLPVNISNLAAVIQNANFDVGHLLTRVYGGVAYLSSVCGSSKAGGISGIPRGGDVDVLAFLVMAHELGHQFGATHTFSGTRGRCGNNATLASAWEAGSGSSPMAYPGACPVGGAAPSDNIVTFADPWFHHGSIEQIRALFANRACPAQSQPGNQVPVITTPPANWQIPPGTPFTLSAAALDPDGDTLLFSWEQFDAGVARPISGDGSADTGAGALFRIFPPVAVAQRTFPRMADVLTGDPTPGERLPTVEGASRRFRVVVRDQRAGAAGVALSASSTVTVATGTTPFALVSPPPPSPIAVLVTVPPGSNLVTWSVGGTDSALVGCSTVDIRFSSDDGATFPVSLGTFPNTGAAMVTYPAGVPAARLKISAVGNIFFAVSARFVVEFCTADINRDGSVTLQDIFSFLAAYFGGDLSADVNDSGNLSVQDIFEFLTALFAGCGS